MELSCKSWLYRLMSLYCDPAENICEFIEQLMPILIVTFILLFGTIGFSISFSIGLYDIPKDQLPWMSNLLAFLSFISLTVIVSTILGTSFVFIINVVLDKLEEKLKKRKESLKISNKLIRHLNPIKSKAEKFCIKIKYKD